LTARAARDVMPPMPPTSAHLNGSVNLEDTETVMREVAGRIPEGLRRIPDGETGDRGNWIWFQFQKFQQMDALELESPDADPSQYTTPTLKVREGVDPASVEWPDLGYAAVYAQSFATFTRLQHEGAVPAGVRFQAQYPTPLASIAGFIAAADQMALLPSYEAALFADLQSLLAAVPHDRVAVQWDVAVEFGLLEQAAFDTAVGDTGWVTDAVARCIDQVPADVPAGAHLCYGDYGHKHFLEPASLATQVGVIHALGEKASRPLSFVSLTVPQNATAPEYFAPLAELRVPDETELYLALVPYHPESQASGTTDEQIRLVDEQLGTREWGICTECGMGRVEREDVLPMLDSYREILRSQSSLRS
jgi:hypothetical protein